MELKLIDDVYTSMLRAVGLEVTSDYFVRMNVGGQEYVPVTKGGRQMVLPVSEQLRHIDIGNRLVFHPLNDNAITKDSEILTFYRHILVNRINVVCSVLGAELLQIAASTKAQSVLTPDQQEFLRLVPEADQRSIDDFSAIGTAASKANQLQQAFVTIYLKKGVPLKGKTYQRIASINFPFYKELLAWEEEEKNRKAAKAKKTTKGDHEIYDVGVRVKDRETFKGIMQYLLPNVEEEHFYDTGSNSQIAPGLDAMMRSFIPLAAHLNAIMELFEGVIPDVADMMFDTDWAVAFENLDVLWNQIRAIPEQSAAVSEPEPAKAAAPAPAPVTRPLPWQDAPAAPYHAPQPAYQAPQQQRGSSDANGVSLRDLINNQPQVGYPNSAPGYPPAGGYSPYGQQQPGFPPGMGGYPAQQQPYRPPFVPAGPRRY